MGTYSTNITLAEPTPFDPSVANAWGTILNTNFTLIDSAVAGLLPLSVAGNSNVILTSISGAADQARNQIFIFSGALTGSIYVFWPMGLSRSFSVTNSTTGAFTLTLAVNNGSGSPAGTTVAIAQGATIGFYSDGTNIVATTAAVTNALLTTGGTMTGAFNEAVATNIASASTINLTTATGNYVTVTGTAGISTITLAAGARRVVQFAGALTLTYNASSLILPGQANITTAAGDTTEIWGTAAGVIAVWYQRAAGGFVGSIAQSQVTGLVTALAGKGALSGGNSWTGQQTFNNQVNGSAGTLTDGATINWNVQTAQVATVTLGGNRTMAAPTNLVSGGSYALFVIQDGTGTRTLTWNVVFKWPSGTAPTLSTAAGSVDIISFISNGTNLYGVAQKAFA